MLTRSLPPVAHARNATKTARGYVRTYIYVRSPLGRAVRARARRRMHAHAPAACGGHASRAARTGTSCVAARVRMHPRRGRKGAGIRFTKMHEFHCCLFFFVQLSCSGDIMPSPFVLIYGAIDFLKILFAIFKKLM